MRKGKGKLGRKRGEDRGKVKRKSGRVGGQERATVVTVKVVVECLSYSVL